MRLQKNSAKLFDASDFGIVAGIWHVVGVGRKPRISKNAILQESDKTIYLCQHCFWKCVCNATDIPGGTTDHSDCIYYDKNIII